MDTKIVVFIVGFDEKLVIRAGFRVGLQPYDTVLLVYSLSGSEYDKTRVSNAVRIVKEVFTSAGAVVKELLLGANDFGVDVASLVNALKQLNSRKVVISIASGMRYLGLVALCAGLIYKEIEKSSEVNLYVAREDGVYDVIMNLETLSLSIGPSEMRALCLVDKLEQRDELVKKLSNTLGKTFSTVYSLLNRMERKGFIKLDKNNVSLTPLGEALKHSLCTTRDNKEPEEA